MASEPKDEAGQDAEQGLHLLSSGSGDDAFDGFTNRQKRVGSHSTLRLILVAIICLITGIIIGQGTSDFVHGTLKNTFNKDALPQPEGDSSMTFEIDTDFIGPPSDVFEERWRSVIPTGRGFLSHPSFDPQVKAFTVFHQLHCLYSMTTAFWKVADGASLSETHHGQPIQLHFGHCTEFLRQALMCHADVNLEDVADVQVGAAGWGFPRVCHDFDAVKAAAERWAYGNGTGIH